MKIEKLTEPEEKPVLTISLTAKEAKLLWALCSCISGANVESYRLQTDTLRTSLTRLGISTHEDLLRKNLTSVLYDVLKEFVNE